MSKKQELITDELDEWFPESAEDSIEAFGSLLKVQFNGALALTTLVLNNCRSVNANKKEDVFQIFQESMQVIEKQLKTSLKGLTEITP